MEIQIVYVFLVYWCGVILHSMKISGFLPAAAQRLSHVVL